MFESMKPDIPFAVKGMLSSVSNSSKFKSRWCDAEGKLAMTHCAPRGSKKEAGAGSGARRANEMDSHQTTTSKQEAEETPAPKKARCA